MMTWDRATRRRRALVTGGAGFIGSHLCDQLVAEGLEVTCLDNFQTGRVRNVQHLLASSLFTLIEADVAEFVPQEPFDEIWNLACPASPPAYQRDPIGTLLTCVLGARNCLELARATGARMLQASTSEVYGDAEVHPQVEAYRGQVNPVGPRACYDEGKRAAEALCFDYKRLHQVEIKVARIFNTYGPRMAADDGRVVSNFIAQALKSRPLTLYGDGSQTRSFCYVGDLVDGLFKLMRSPPEVTGPINIGNPGEFTIAELASLVVELTGSSGALRHETLPEDDPRQRRPDITLAQNELRWSPRVPLRDGLQATIAHLRQEIAAEPALAAE